jgi:hypothetical protein
MGILIIFILISVGSSAMAARYAQKKGRDYWDIFFISLMITPLFLLVSDVKLSDIKKSVFSK